MYGSVYRFRPLPGREEDALEELRRWGREQRQQAIGFVIEYTYRSEKIPGDYINTAVFESREAYQSNGDLPEQDAWYRRFRSHLREDPEWEDGEIVCVVR